MTDSETLLVEEEEEEEGEGERGRGNRGFVRFRFFGFCLFFLKEGSEKIPKVGGKNQQTTFVAFNFASKDSAWLVKQNFNPTAFTVSIKALVSSNSASKVLSSMVFGFLFCVFRKLSSRPDLIRIP